MNNSMTADIQSGNVPTSSHQLLYKHKGVSSGLLHEKHRQEIFELRKKKRDDGFINARSRLSLNRVNEQNIEPELRSVFDQELIDNLNSGEDDRVLDALQTYSRLFSSQECIDHMHEIGLINVVIEIFMRSDPLTELESICIIVLSKLSNEFDRISSFLDPGVIAKLVNSLHSTNVEVLEHAVFLLEEIVRHDPYTRTTCDQLKIVPISIELYFRHDHLSLRRQILTMINNYFEYEALVHDITKEFLEFIHYIILNEADELLLSDAFETLVKIAQFSQSHANLLITEGYLTDAIQFLDTDVAQSCMLFVRAVAAYGEEHVKVLSDLGYFGKVWFIANSRDNPPKKRGNALSAVATFIKNGYLSLNPEAASTVTDQLIESLKESCFEIRRQSLFAIGQLLNVCSDADILIKFTQSSCLANLCDLLTVMHVDTVLAAIKCLSKIMDYGVSSGIDVELCNMLESLNAQEKFDFLTQSQSYEVFKQADAFINRYLASDMSGDEADLRCT